MGQTGGTRILTLLTNDVQQPLTFREQPLTFCG